MENGYHKVSIVILNWRSADLTTACVQSLESLDYPNYEIILIDNGSQDGSETILRTRFPNYDFIQTGNNLGYACGNNQGIKLAVEKGAEYVWILNPDIAAEPPSLKRMMEVISKDPSIGICGPRILQGFPPKIRCLDGAMVYPQICYDQKDNEIEDWQRQFLPEADNVVYVPGCSILIKAEVFKRIGLFREDFFLYYEEVELCFRAQRNGWKTVVCRNAINHHRWTDQNKQREIVYYGLRNRILLARIQEQYLWRTVWICLKRGALDNFKAVAAGLIKPVKPIPRLPQQFIRDGLSSAETGINQTLSKRLFKNCQTTASYTKQ